MLNKKFIPILFLLFTLKSFSAVWEDTNTWSPEFEKNYQDWVEKNWTKYFFSSKNLPDGSENPFLGLRLDCADNVYSTRIIFSYFNKLPFAMNDSSGGKKLITNKMNRWDKLSENKKIRNFLVYIFNLTSTKSMHRDTYPVALTADTIHAGNMILTTESNHHSWMIKSILFSGIPHLVFNSSITPTSTAVMQERDNKWPNGVWVFQDNSTPAGNAGIRYWRPLEYLKEPVWSVPGYSEDQYKLKPSQWSPTLTKLLKKRDEDAQGKVDRIIRNICADIDQRIDAVNDAELAAKAIEYACMSAEDFDTHSTPNKDARLADAILDLRSYYKEIRAKKSLESIDKATLEKLKKIFPYPDLKVRAESQKQTASKFNQYSVCPATFQTRLNKEGRKLDLAEIKRRLFLGRLSSNPNDPIEMRFGEYISDYQNSCEVFGDIKLKYNE